MADFEFTQKSRASGCLITTLSLSIPQGTKAMEIFDPQMYLDATLDKPLEKRPAAAASTDYSSMIKDVKGRKWQSQDKTDDFGNLLAGIALDVQHEVTLTAEQAKLVGQEKIVLTDGFILNLTPNGTIDDAKGRNSRVRQYREALDMNKPGDSWSPRRMIGRTLKLQLKHEIYQGDIVERIGPLARAS